MRQAAILVGGRGTRLGELAQHEPKPLMAIDGDRRFLDYVLENFARFGLSEILLLAGHKAEHIVSRYDGASVHGADIRVICEQEAAGTAGALLGAADSLDECFFLANGDSLFDFNLLDLGRALQPGDLAVLALRRVEDAGRYGRVALEQTRINGFFEKDTTWRGAALISAGVYALRREILDRITYLPCSLEQEIFPALASERRLAGLEAAGYFLDIGLPETLAKGRAELPAQMRRPAAFFDRDGTLTRDLGYTYRTEDLEWLPGAIEAIRLCNRAGYLVVVVTNQSAVARGICSEADVRTFHAAMQAQLQSRGAHIDAFYYCPYHSEGVIARYIHPDHPNRKPNPGMILRALRDWPIDGARSFLVGDKPDDAAAAAAAGIAGRVSPPGAVLNVVRNFLPQSAGPDPSAVSSISSLIREP
jgi:histidinol-phosphate phosphatase family protein